MYNVNSPLALLVVIPALVFASSCSTERTVTDVGEKSGSDFYRSTLGANPGDFSKRSRFDSFREDGKENSFFKKSFDAPKSRLQENIYVADDSNLRERTFEARDKESGFDGVSSFQGRSAERVAGNFDEAERSFATSAVAERFRRSADYGASRYDAEATRIVGDWQADSLPPKIIQTPDSDEEFTELESIDNLRQVLGK